MTSSELLFEAKKITDEGRDILENNFLPLSPTQKKWRINNQSWNILEIFAHLNKFASYYHLTFERIISKTKFKTPKENFVSSPLGRSAWKSMKLGNSKNVKRRLKSLRQFNPLFDKQLVSGNDEKDFVENLKQLSEIIEKAKQVNIRKVKIPISISKIIRLRLGDALLFVVYHNERHIQQAVNILQHPNFPK
ncbi:MAG: DinB family protein [Flavobacteriia bacterium]|nr:DinB family protein [Flavobacteriia bacterium]